MYQLYFRKSHREPSINFFFFFLSSYFKLEDTSFKLEDNSAIQQCESAISMCVCVCVCVCVYIYMYLLPHEPPSHSPPVSFLTRVLRY